MAGANHPCRGLRRVRLGRRHHADRGGRRPRRRPADAFFAAKAGAAGGVDRRRCRRRAAAGARPGQAARLSPAAPRAVVGAAHRRARRRSPAALRGAGRVGAVGQSACQFYGRAGARRLSRRRGGGAGRRRPTALGGSEKVGHVCPRRICCRAADASRRRRSGAAIPADGNAGVADDFCRMVEPRFPEIAGARNVDPRSAPDRLCERCAAAADPAAAAAQPRPHDAAARPARRRPRHRRAARTRRPARARSGRPHGAAGTIAAFRLGRSPGPAARRCGGSADARACRRCWPCRRRCVRLSAPTTRRPPAPRWRRRCASA